MLLLGQFNYERKESLTSRNGGLFAYRIFIRAEAMPTVDNLLHETISGSDVLKAEMIGQAS